MVQFILPVLVAAVYAQILGALWYSKFLFGTMWMKASGLDPANMGKDKKQMGVYMGIAFLGAIVTAGALSLVTPWAGQGIMGGVWAGFLVWLGFVTVTQFDTVLWDGKSWKYFAINTLYSLVKYVGMGVILGSWLT